MMFKWLGGLVDRGCAVIGAIIFAQIPLFIQDYTQQLIGRTAELKIQVDAMRHAASLSGKSLEQLTQKFLENSDPDVMRQGLIMQSLVNRWHQLSEALSSLQDSSVWARPFVFLYHINTDVFSSTLTQFKVGLPLTLEGGVYALLGIICGYLIVAFLKKTFKKINTVLTVRTEAN